jgi:EpsI family protein
METVANRKPLIAAVITAAGLLLVSGTAFRILADYLARPGDSIPLPPGTLARLPLRIGEWEGRDVPLSEAIIRATDTDAHINRVYSQSTRGETVALFIAYGVRARDLMPHRPEVCYPGAGWTLLDTRSLEVPLADGTRLLCSIYTFSRTGGLDSQAISVLNYYVVDGDYCPDVSLLRSKAWRGSGGIRYMAQVQITCSGGAALTAEARLEAVRAFAVAAGSSIRALLPESSPAPAETAGTVADPRRSNP